MKYPHINKFKTIKTSLLLISFGFTTTNISLLPSIEVIPDMLGPRIVGSNWTIQISFLAFWITFHKY